MTRTLFLFLFLIGLIIIAAEVIWADAETWEPTHKYFEERTEIHIINVWIQMPDELCPPDCHIYPLRLMSEMPPQCRADSVGCILDTGIYILNGMQGKRPADGGCSVLWHEIRHIHLQLYDPEEEHRIMQEESRCD